MSFDFKILGSSSKGNCSLFITEGCKVLIDAGFSGKRITELLEEIGEDIRDVNAIFFTHEHSDHGMGLRGLSRYEHLEFFANTDTAESLQKGINRKINWKIFETGSTFGYKDLEVTTFSIPHDATDPVGYLFSVNEASLAWVTDLGYLPQMVQEKIRHVDVLVLESNYDCSLLEEDLKRPWSIKQRIQGRHGHLSNEAAFAFLSGTKDHKWKQIYLAHLSRDCNSIDRIREVFAPLLNNSTPYYINIIDPEQTPYRGVYNNIFGTKEQESHGILT